MKILFAWALSFLAIVANDAGAANRSSRATGNWGAAIWAATNNCTGAAGSAATPTAADDVFICNGTTVTVDEYRWSEAIVAGGPGIAGDGLTERLIGADGCTYVTIDGYRRSYFDNVAEALSRAFEVAGWNLTAVDRCVGNKEFARVIYK